MKGKVVLVGLVLLTAALAKKARGNKNSPEKVGPRIYRNGLV